MNIRKPTTEGNHVWVLFSFLYLWGLSTSWNNISNRQKINEYDSYDDG